MSSRSPIRCIWALIRPTGPVVIPTRLHIYSGPPVSTTHTRAATCGATSKQHRPHRDSAGRELALASGRASLPALAVASCHHRNEALRVQQQHPARELRPVCGPAAPATQAQEGAVTASCGFEGEAKASTCTEVAAVMRMIIAIDASYTWTSQQHPSAPPVQKSALRAVLAMNPLPIRAKYSLKNVPFKAADACQSTSYSMDFCTGGLF